VEKGRFINQHRLLIEAIGLVKASASDRRWFGERARKAFEFWQFSRERVGRGD